MFTVLHSLTGQAVSCIISLGKPKYQNQNTAQTFLSPPKVRILATSWVDSMYLQQQDHINSRGIYSNVYVQQVQLIRIKVHLNSLLMPEPDKFQSTTNILTGFNCYHILRLLTVLCSCLQELCKCSAATSIDTL